MGSFVYFMVLMNDDAILLLSQISCHGITLKPTYKMMPFMITTFPRLRSFISLWTRVMSILYHFTKLQP